MAIPRGIAHAGQSPCAKPDLPIGAAGGSRSASPVACCCMDGADVVMEATEEVGYESERQV